MMRHGTGWMLAFLALWGVGGCAKSVTSTPSDGGTQPRDGHAGGGQMGMACSSSEECESGLCLGVGAEFFCSSPCGECPEGTYCGKVDSPSAPSGEQPPQGGYFCLPDRLMLCEPCETSLDCAFPSDECLTLSDGTKVCGRDCTYDGTCPDGYVCQQGQCRPNGETCDCTAERIGAVRRCEITNEYGTCTGTETCYVAGWEGCDARTPAPEACNGIDDDCDGVLPEGELDLDGNGKPDCQDNCVPEPEVCDLKDNDCNGQVDDGSPQTLCGTIPNGVPACRNGTCVVDTCAEGFVDLDGEFSNGCECQLPPASGGPSCDQAEDLGSMSDSGQTLTVRGIVGEGEELWYRVYAIDEPDTPGPSCDSFHFRAYFKTNPNDTYVLEVRDGTCDASPVCQDPGTDFSWYTNYREGSGESAVGECDCVADPSVNGEGVNQCQDESRVFLIGVKRLPNKPAVCQSFELEISNGLYTP